MDTLTMHFIARLFTGLVFAGLMLGCSVSGYIDEAPSFSQLHAQSQATQRQVIKSARIKIEVNEPLTIANDIIALVERESGFIANTHHYDQKTVSMDVRIPAIKLENFVAAVALKGKLLSKSVNAQDVTTEIIDIEAKLKNLLVLRDRFRALLSKADKVSEILDIEKELSRIQSEIDSIEGHRKSLRHQLAFSKVDITIKQKTLYGPLGYIGLGLYWLTEKLFVIK